MEATKSEEQSFSASWFRVQGMGCLESNVQGPELRVSTPYALIPSPWSVITKPYTLNLSPWT